MINTPTNEIWELRQEIQTLRDRVSRLEGASNALRPAWFPDPRPLVVAPPSIPLWPAAPYTVTAQYTHSTAE